MEGYDLHHYEWPMGKITKNFPDKKGVVRTIELEEDGHKSLHPVTYVVSLELDCNDPEDDIEQDRRIQEEEEVDDDIHQLPRLTENERRENGSNELTQFKESVQDTDRQGDREKEESAALCDSGSREEGAVALSPGPGPSYPTALTEEGEILGTAGRPRWKAAVEQ